MELKSISRVMAFTQEKVAGDFIERTTKKRGNAKTKVQKNLFKFINNILFGKSIQNNRDHINVAFVRTRKKMSELARKKNFLNYQKIASDFVAVSSRPEKVKMDRAFAIGFTILEKSKYV